MSGSRILQPHVEFLLVANVERSVQVLRADDRVAVDRNCHGCVRGPTRISDPWITNQRIDEAVSTAETGVRLVAEGAVFQQNQSSFGHIGLEGSRQHVIVDVMVVG